MAKGKQGGGAGPQKGIKRDLSSNKLRKNKSKTDIKANATKIDRQLDRTDTAVRIAKNMIGGAVGRVADQADKLSKQGINNLINRAGKAGIKVTDIQRSVRSSGGSAVNFFNDVRKKVEAREIKGPAGKPKAPTDSGRPKKPIDRKAAARKAWATRRARGK